jgi:uncharacterized protein
MTAWFMDTYYFLALRNPTDAGHAKALALTRQLGPQKLVTTTWVLTEVADALAAPLNRSGFPDLLRRLRSDPNTSIVPCEEALFQRGVDLYESRPDKEWSLTDCISFVAMQEQGLTEALTGDHHFEQAGFRALLK